MKFGRYPCHKDYARSFSGKNREFRVTTPEGDYADFDAMDRSGALYEVKTGYQLIPLQPDNPISKNNIEKFLDQAVKQFYVAARCGRRLEWHFNNEPVADFFGKEGADPSKVKQPLPAPVYYTPFKCGKDSDEIRK
jgi:hypothetical protein